MGKLNVALGRKALYGLPAHEDTANPGLPALNSEVEGMALSNQNCPITFFWKIYLQTTHKDCILIIDN